MDFMKVVDQAVREIKREVNIKVLKVPEIEQKVLDATSNEPWGPHGTVLGEIAQATKKFTECQLIMNTLWTRLADSSRNWRHVYKALAVIEYLIGHGSERAVDDIIEHSFQISSLSGFEYVEPNGKDVGINVRKKVETIMTLLSNKDKIQEVRNKAAANRDKYIGLSSSGMSYKPSSASYGSSSFYHDDHYGGFGSTKDSEMHKSRDRDDDAADWNHAKKQSYSRDGRDRSRLQSNLGHRDEGIVSKKESTYSASRDEDDSYGPIPSTQSSSSLQKKTEDDFEDDFDPRASSTTGSAAGRPNQVDLFGESLIGGLMDAPVPVMSSTTNGNNTSTEVDLFADAAFVSTPPNMEAHGGSHTEASVDLFAPSAFPAASSSTVDFFAAADYSLPIEVKPSKSEPTSTSTADPFAAPSKPDTTSASMVDPFGAPSKPENRSSGMVDPFAAMPLNNFEGSDVFGDFTSHTAAASKGQPEDSAGENFSASNQNISKEAKITAKKDTFQVKSGIWADSLSRGLIDLNISAPKKVSLADIGVVGGLSDGTDEKGQGPPASTYGMGRAMGAGSGMGKLGFNPATSGGMRMGRGGDGSLSKLRQYDFGSFK